MFIHYHHSILLICRFFPHFHFFDFIHISSFILFHSKTLIVAPFWKLTRFILFGIFYDSSWRDVLSCTLFHFFLKLFLPIRFHFFIRNFYLHHLLVVFYYSMRVCILWTTTFEFTFLTNERMLPTFCVAVFITVSLLSVRLFCCQCN